MRPDNTLPEVQRPSEAMGAVALAGTNPPSTPDMQSVVLPHQGVIDPVPVVKVLSVRGVEYAMMTIGLWLSAISLAWILVNIINNSANFEYLAVPVSILITSLPIFSLLFLRLKRAELANPILRLEPSKRRMSQITQILAFLAVIINISTFVYQVLQKVSGNSSPDLLRTGGSLLVVLLIAGGILAYYWFDEHRAARSI